MEDSICTALFEELKDSFSVLAEFIVLSCCYFDDDSGGEIDDSN